MLAHVFPMQFDNNYRGSWLAVFLFVPIALVKGAQGFNSMIMPHAIMTGPDGIPVDSFGSDGAAAALGVFALLGLNVLVLPVISLIAVIRYRAMIPLLYLLFLAVSFASRVVAVVDPIPRAAGGPPLGFTVNLVVLVVTLIGFALSITPRAGALAQA